MMAITYPLYLDDDAIPLESSNTVGNHLEADIVVPGEDIADFHLRIEITDRGPVLVPLVSATFNINGVETNELIRTIVGDVVTLGQAPECTVFIQHSSIHDRHVRLDVAADGIRLTHLTTPGLTQVNSTVVDTVMVQAGDKIQLADVAFCLQVFEPPVRGWKNFPNVLKKRGLAICSASFVFAISISVLLLS